MDADLQCFNIMYVVCVCDFTGQSHIFNESEMYQRAFLHWNRAAVQGDVRLTQLHFTDFLQ